MVLKCFATPWLSGSFSAEGDELLTTEVNERNSKVRRADILLKARTFFGTRLVVYHSSFC